MSVDNTYEVTLSSLALEGEGKAQKNTAKILCTYPTNSYVG